MVNVGGRKFLKIGYLRLSEWYQKMQTISLTGCVRLICTERGREHGDE